MGDAGFYRGTSSEQDSRFTDKERKLLKQMRFESNLDEKICMDRVNLDVLKPWITAKLNEILGMEDDVLIEYVFTQLEEKNISPKVMQINLTGFLNARRAREFMGELWQMMLEAQSSEDGIPASLVEKKVKELQEKTKEVSLTSPNGGGADSAGSDWKNRYDSLTGGRYGNKGDGGGGKDPERRESGRRNERRDSERGRDKGDRERDRDGDRAKDDSRKRSTDESKSRESRDKDRDKERERRREKEKEKEKEKEREKEKEERRVSRQESRSPQRRRMSIDEKPDRKRVAHSRSRSPRRSPPRRRFTEQKEEKKRRESKEDDHRKKRHVSESSSSSEEDKRRKKKKHKSQKKRRNSDSDSERAEKKRKKHKKEKKRKRNHHSSESD